MAGTKTKYSATFTKNEEPITTEVVMTALPYGEFGPENPLYIIDNVDMGKGKKAPLPDFSHVIIDGTFDCSDFIINETSVLPIGITELICLHSIKSLSALIGKLPQSVMQVTVRPAILNAIKKNLGEHKETVQQFMEQYPHVLVTDGKQGLAEILTLDEMAKNAPQTKVKAEQKVNKTTTPTKTSDWLSTDEVINICIDLSEDLATLTQLELIRYVQMARSSKSNLNLRCQKMLREDGAEITCIHNNEISKVIDFIGAKVAKARTPKKETTKKQTKTEAAATVQEPIQVNDTDSAFFDNVELKVVQIDKYITKRVWKKIQSKCANNVGAMLNVLRDIEAINVDQTQIKTNGRSRNAVYIDEKGKPQTSSTVESKFPFLTQGFGTLDDRTRIIWVTYGNKCVAQHFLTDHTDPKSHAKYKKILSSKNIDLSDFDWDAQLKVPDLIKALSDDSYGPDPELPDEIPSTKDDHDDIDATEVPMETNASSNAMVDMDTQEVKDIVITETPKTETPVVDITPAKPTTKETTKRTKNPVTQQKTWQALYFMHAEFTTTIKNIDLRQKQIASELLIMETEASIKLTEELQQLLAKKLAYEEALKKFREAALYMQEIQNKYNKQK